MGGYNGTNPGTFVLILRKIAFSFFGFRNVNLSSQYPKDDGRRKVLKIEGTVVWWIGALSISDYILGVQISKVCHDSLIKRIVFHPNRNSRRLGSLADSLSIAYDSLSIAYS